jgi:hypothetical protein
MTLVRAKGRSVSFHQGTMGDTEFMDRFNTICDVVVQQGGSFSEPGLLLEKAKAKGITATTSTTA